MTLENKTEANSVLVAEVVKEILGDKLSAFDEFMAQVRATFVGNKEILDADLNRIVLQIPTYCFDLIELDKFLEMKKGLSKEQTKFATNEALLTATGTVAEKQAKADNAVAKEKLEQLAYHTASSIISSKLDGALAIWDAAKKVQAMRAKEMALVGQATSGVSAF